MMRPYIAAASPLITEIVTLQYLLSTVAGTGKKWDEWNAIDEDSPNDDGESYALVCEFTVSHRYLFTIRSRGLLNP